MNLPGPVRAWLHRRYCCAQTGDLRVECQGEAWNKRIATFPEPGEHTTTITAIYLDGVKAVGTALSEEKWMQEYKLLAMPWMEPPP